MKNTIAVCTTRMDENFQTDCILTITHKANECGLHVQVYNVFEDLINHDNYDQGEESVYDLIHFDRLCGMILFCEKIKDEELIARLIRAGKDHGIPVVSLDRRLEDCYNIIFDYANSYELIVRHLLEVHHCKKIYMMAGFRNNQFSDERVEVVRRVMAEYGLSLTEDDIGYGDFWDIPAREVMQKYLESGRALPDVFLSANDTMAITICDELTKYGYQVPRDVLVTGFDGIELEKYYVPRLTTAQQNIDLCGERAVEIIRGCQYGRTDMAKDTMIPFTIRYAQSCGCQPIMYKSASAQIRNMYNALTDQRYFDRRMYEMIIELTSKQGLYEMIQCLEKYMSFLACMQHIYLCVRLDIAEKDERISEILRLRYWNDDTAQKNDMVVIGEYHQKTGFTMPMTEYRYQMQLPDYEDEMEQMKNVVFVPLHMQETVYGYLVTALNLEETGYYKIGNFGTNLSHSMDSVIKRYEMQKMNEKLVLANEKLEELYVRDSMTGIYNRRGFYQELMKRLKEQTCGYLMMVSVDLDCLKVINDTYGHSEGDFAIKSVSRAVLRCSAVDGICARFGGDEFTAVLFYREYEAYAGSNFKRQLSDFLNRTNKTAGKPYHISASCGYQMGAIDMELNVDALLKQADDKMYESKKKTHRELLRKSRRD